jgi:hypothetical protein
MHQVGVDLGLVLDQRLKRARLQRQPLLRAATSLQHFQHPSQVKAPEDKKISLPRLSDGCGSGVVALGA